MIKRLWSSATFTAWGNKVAQSLRLIVLLPLIIRNFNDVELAAWLMFSSLVFFSNLLMQQSSLVFARMVALVFGGAEDISPYKHGEKRKSLGQANWLLMGRLYSTMQSVNICVSILGGIVTVFVGIFSLKPILKGYDASSDVWLAFFILLGCHFLSEFFCKFASTLRGLNQVALVNRWEIVFSVLSTIAGSITLLLGGHIVIVTLVMQLFYGIRLIRLWILLHYVVEPKFRKMRIVSWDVDIIRSAWVPVWRGLVQAFANRGGSKVCAIFLARNTDVQVISGVLLAIRLLEVLEQVALAPFTSNIPRIAKYLGEGRIDIFRRSIIRAMSISIRIQVVGVIVLGYFTYLVLYIADSTVSFLSQEIFFILGLTFTLVSSIRMSLMISAVGNNIVAVRRLMIAAVMTAICSALIIPVSPIYGFIISSYIPIILIVNLHPLSLGSNLLELTMINLILKVFLWPLLLLFIIAVLSYVLPMNFSEMDWVNLLKNKIGSFQ